MIAAGRRPLLQTLLTPRVIGIVFVAALILLVLFRPRFAPVESALRLTTYSPDPFGAQGLYDVLDRLGWEVRRRTTPLTDTIPRHVVYAVLAPPIALTSRQTHYLLEAVRAGARLIVIPTRGSPLADSLDIRQSVQGFYAIAGDDDDEMFDEEEDEEAAEEEALSQREAIGALMTPQPSGCEPGVFDQPFGTRWLGHYLEMTGPIAGPPAPLLEAVVGRGNNEPAVRRPAALGFDLGRGRVLAIADGQMLRNDVIRLCNRDAGVRIISLLGWISSPGDTIVFDEYHMGFGRHPSILRATRDALLRTPAGRMLTQALVAGLVLVLALSPRPLPVARRSRFERRSPLEYVGALARAYEQVGASRTAVRRLVRGLRRRIAPAAREAMSDEQFLAHLGARTPSIAPDAQMLRDAAQRTLTPEELLAVGQAIERIERTVIRR